MDQAIPERQLESAARGEEWGTLSERVPNDNDQARARVPSISNERTVSMNYDERSMVTCKRFALWVVFQIIFPLLALTISSAFGGLLAWAEGEPFLTGFLYVASNLMSMANPLTDFNPSDAIGIVIDIYVSVIALLLFGVILNVVHIFQVPATINGMIQKFATGGFIVPFIAIFFLIPLSLGATAGVFGSILAALEGWSTKDGVYYVIGNLLGLGTALTDVLPDTVTGDVLDIIVSSFALGTLAVFVDYVTFLNPARYIRKWLKDYLQWNGIYNLADDVSNDGSSSDYPEHDARGVKEAHEENLTSESKDLPIAMEEQDRHANP